MERITTQTQSNKYGHRQGMSREGSTHRDNEAVSAMMAKAFRKLGYTDGEKPKMSAILKTSTVPQIIGAFTDASGGCALGVLGIHSGTMKNGKLQYHDMVAAYAVSFEEMQGRAGACPCCKKTDLTIWGMIPHLNDIHEQSLRQVGEWLETKGL